MLELATNFKKLICCLALAVSLNASDLNNALIDNLSKAAGFIPPTSGTRNPKITIPPSPSYRDLATRVLDSHFSISNFNSNSYFELYKELYIMPIYHSFTPQADPAMLANEAKFQLSFKVKVINNFLNSKLNLYFAYTQNSFWQMYNKNQSKPFRDNDFAPEVFLSLKVAKDGANGLSEFRFGYRHKSNGEYFARSRTSNVIYADFLWRMGYFMLESDAFFYVKTSGSFRHDNPDLPAYMGYGNLKLGLALYKGIATLAINNPYSIFDKGRFKGSIVFEFIYPIYRAVSLYTQVFYGYNDNLFEHKHKSSRIGIGFSVTRF